MTTTIENGANSVTGACCASRPVAFGSSTGLYAEADQGTRPSGVAVLFLNPWGMEEMCTRRFYRILAERLSGIGVASLRFDFSGTVNSLDETAGERGLSVWQQQVATAAETLRELSGARSLVFLGQGIGASLALLSADKRPSPDALALLAPVLKGRAYLRELSLYSRLIDDGLGIKPELRDNAAGSIAGIRMPRAVADDLRRLDLTKVEIDAPPDLFLAVRPGLESDVTLCHQLEAAGCRLRATDFAGYDAFVSNPLNQEIPDAVARDLIDWVQSLPGYQSGRLSARTMPMPVASVRSRCIRETAVRFGPDERLHGILCEPTDSFAGVTAVILTTAYDHAAGWGRFSVELARALATAGVASFRFDSAGVGDSPPVPGRRRQVLYDEAQVDDVIIARDFLEQHGPGGSTILIGRCSGAYVAFRSVLADPRWDACILVNPVAFRWRFRGLPKTLKSYLKNALDRESLLRLWAGDLDLRAVTRNISVRLVDRMASRLSSVFAPAKPLTQLTRQVHRDFQVLADRSMPLAIVYTEGDEGQDMFRVNFGDAGERLSAYPNVALHLFPDADHNLTPMPARERLIELAKVEALAISAASLKKSMARG
ncbi:MULTISPECIES: serine aminopeptidase domain-containing protein [unclassified Rhizobium]|uniref:serine aminopeptidase domain-containing protein n=1 Tax=unclassified Rhizobium TaxID=2613769 RepID=UPI00160CCC7F|nr:MULTISPECIES: alpha/beta hydrolase [unclassified Rhizobium]MBB3320261.1 alpha-beta hydrolase superfamily lysophospholipase [Rhizobium sp. BK181]MCS3742707.1 alpha-beta hydrolase superfamily lysophospholipase [Rhizobium sp. BK661]MCS4096017.1 alpha-beta hydrolase superfamily lysophospholipase [Rhizobium sp. BK176]